MRLLGNFTYYSVCVPIHQNHLVFELRSSWVPQPLEISFPGGKIEEDETPYEAAIRELYEEIGVGAGKKLFDIEPIVTPFNTVIFSYAVEVDLSSYKLNKSEVLDIFTVPIDHFSNPYKMVKVDVTLNPSEDFPYELIPHGRNYPWKRGTYEIMFYKWGGHVIWGITANIAHRAWEIFEKIEKDQS
ncbi:MAG: NUDIX hydrolase [Fervidobacterium sp.]